MQQETLPEVSWDPREPETRPDHHPRGVLHEIARLRLWENASHDSAPDTRITGSAPAKARA
jgi:hypothetical protein